MRRFSHALLLCLALPLSVSTAPAQPNAPSPETREYYERLLQTLPFNDTRSFSEAREGFIAPLPNNGVVKNANGEVVYDLQKFDFIMQGSVAPDTVNPSLWRQSQLVTISGLFQVSNRIYQVRAADLSNITFIEGDTGIIVVDPLISQETARYALDFYYEHRPRKPVIAVIYTHSHVDHYGGVRGVVDEADVTNGTVKIYAPEGFLEHAIAENVMAGNAMSRRASYMYGNLLPYGPQGQVGAGLGPTTSTGTITLIPPTDVITKTGETRQIDGLTLRFLMAPNSEAPSEMFFYISQLRALCTAEDAVHTLHNTYSLRGAKIRDPLAWSKYINETIYEYGNRVEVLFAPHHWPLKGNDRVLEHLRGQRNLYRFINDQPLRLLNHGFHKTEIAEMIEMPSGLRNNWSARGYYGTSNHNIKSTYVHYLGWFDGNPASLHKHTERDAAKRYVEFMGGPDALLQKARESYEEGDYRWVAEVVNHLVFAEPDNQEAKNLQADALEQMGYQAESGPWRNFYLTGAQELRIGVKELPAPTTASPDTVRAMDLDLLFDYVAMRLNYKKAGAKEFKLNWVFADTNQTYVLELQNATLNHIEGHHAPDAAATITLNRSDLNNVLLGETTFEKAIEDGTLQIQGDPAPLKALLDMLDTFDFWFPMVTPVPLDKAG
ncbi:alkyl/aryl-sulfatase [Pseudovibrio sp. SPO723]|uniref:alkyl/aryl-sulfatase n=1 Tax=Nesiotobacter zosterae TaxID=392721 RepID=UPI0029C1FAA4|nr:alkyl sulfatase dimerization domain-containing protein [Pseudovibrio sp. SPO723]MDX5594076.1 alkyl sulfatase dimerization domain-containing protein [Pseudovibrio sp. SPO723]